MPKIGADTLFELIHSLDKAEKRHFKLYAGSRTEGEAIYLKLFDAIDAQKSHNEKEVIGIVKPPSFRQFSRTKKYLYELILSSVQGLRSRHTVSMEIRSLLDWAEILFDKMLYRQCQKVLNKAKEIAKKYDLYNSILEILTLEYKIAFREYNNKQLLSLQKQEQQALQLLSNTNQYMNKAVSIWDKHLTLGAARKSSDLKEMNEIMNDPILRNEDRALSFYAKRSLLNTHFIYHLTRGDQEECYHLSKRSVQLYLQNPRHIRHSAEYFLGQLNNLLISCAYLKKYAEMPKLMEKLKELSSQLKGKANPVTAFFYRYHALNYYIYTGNFSEGVAEAAEIGESMKKYERFLTPLQKATLWLGIAQVFFGNGNYKQALAWLNNIRNMNELEVRKDVMALTKMFFLIINYEIGDRTIANYLQRQAKYYLSSRKRMYKLEEVLLHFFKTIIPKAAHTTERTKAFVNLRNELLKLSQYPLEKNAFDDFDYISWAESKIEGKSYASLIKRKSALS